MAKESFDSIADTVIEALAFLKKQRDLHGMWQDPANLWLKGDDGSPIMGGGEVMACEGLLSFLMALNRFGARADLKQRIVSIYPLDSLEQDIYDLLLSLRQGGVYGGRPYVHVLDMDGREHPFLDITCYAISIMILAEAVLGEPKTEQRRQTGQRVMEDCLAIVTGSLVYDGVGRAKGWSFTNCDVPSRPYKYFTWMASDTLGDLVELADLNRRYFFTPTVREHVGLLRRVMPQIRMELARIHIDGRHTNEEEQAFGGRNVLISTGKAIQEDEYDQGFSFNLWIIMALMYLGYEDPSVLGAALAALGKMLENAKAKSDQISKSCTILLETSSVFRPDDDRGINKLDDRSFLPQYVKALALLGLWYPDLDPGIDSRIDKAVDWLLANRKDKCPAWDRFSQQGDHAIYQTERAIEALCRVAEWMEARQGAASPHSTSGADVGGSLLSSDQVGELARVVAEVTARHALVVEINGQRAQALIEKCVTEQIAAVRAELEQGVDVRIARFSETLLTGLDRFAEELAKARSGEASVEDALSEAEMLRADMRKLLNINS